MYNSVDTLQFTCLCKEHEHAYLYYIKRLYWLAAQPRFHDDGYVIFFPPYHDALPKWSLKFIRTIYIIVHGTRGCLSPKLKG